MGTISTTTYCYVSNAAKACKRKKRALSYADTIQPLEHREEISGSSVSGSLEEEDADLLSGEADSAQYRDPRFLLYWMTTTSTSTTTSFTATTSIGTLDCTPSGFTISACG